MKEKLTREQWVQGAYAHIVKRLCEPDKPPTPREKKNLAGYAEALAESYFDVEDLDDRINDPVDAVEEDFSCA
jgi:phage gp29-like protein